MEKNEILEYITDIGFIQMANVEDQWIENIIEAEGLKDLFVYSRKYYERYLVMNIKGRGFYENPDNMNNEEAKEIDFEKNTYAVSEFLDMLSREIESITGFELQQIGRMGGQLGFILEHNESMHTYFSLRPTAKEEFKKFFDRNNESAYDEDYIDNLFLDFLYDKETDIGKVFMLNEDFKEALQTMIENVIKTDEMWASDPKKFLYSEH